MSLNFCQQILEQVVNAEMILEDLRQELNQQQQFTPVDLFNAMTSKSTVNVKHINSFMSPREIPSEQLQSVIKFYTHNASLNIHLHQFSSMFLSRNDHLMHKLVMERTPLQQLSNNAKFYAKSIIQKESGLHSKLLTFRRDKYREVKQFIEAMPQYLPRQELEHIFKRIDPQTVQSQFCAFQRYLGLPEGAPIPRENLELLLLLKNSSVITEYLSSRKKSSPKLHVDFFKNPFIHPEFQRCLERPKSTKLLKHREIRSVEGHLQRHQGKTAKQLRTNIVKFKTVTEKHIKAVCMAMAEIIQLEKEIQTYRMDLAECQDFDSRLFYNCFVKDKSGKIVPSVMQAYLKNFKVKVNIKHIFLLFKRFGTSVDGKINFNSFCLMLRGVFCSVNTNRRVEGFEAVCQGTRQTFLTLLLQSIKKEAKMQVIRQKLSLKFSILSDVFSCLDTDEDGLLSMTDLRVGWKRFLGRDIEEEDLKLFWYRLGSLSTRQMISCQDMVWEIIPKGPKKAKKVKPSIK